VVARKKSYHKNCSKCGADQYYGRVDHYKSAIRGDWLCKSCSNSKNNFAGKYERIPITWFEVKKRGGISRGYLWDICIEDIWQMYIDQNGTCALSGKKIDWADKGLTATVSIDRIDSSEGYIKGNVQLLHKDVNFMKQQFSQEYFIQMCQAIANKEKW